MVILIITDFGGFFLFFFIELMLIILNEFFYVYNKNLSDEIIFNSENRIEIILTGRNAPLSFIEKADYVTIMKKGKGVTVQRGIEY